jgi:hypothetical protein
MNSRKRDDQTFDRHFGAEAISINRPKENLMLSKTFSDPSE